MDTCRNCKGELVPTFETLDLTEYQCRGCDQLYTVCQGKITVWPVGTKPANMQRIFEMMVRDSLEC